jgi:peroxiredoxin Q/BCP
MTRLEPGSPAPAFSLLDDRGTKRSLKDFAGTRLILFAYPAAMTPGCTKEACDFRDSVRPLLAAGYAVAGISPDGPAKLAEFRDAEALPYPLVSDPDHSVLKSYGAYGEKSLYGKIVVGVIRSTFIIEVGDNGSGTIIEARYNVKATGHVASLRKALGV